MVDQAVAAGLQEFGDDAAEPPVEFEGAVRTLGGFAVPKDATERRWISPCTFLNKVADKKRIKKVLMPYLPQLATLTTDRKRWSYRR